MVGNLEHSPHTRHDTSFNNEFIIMEHTFRQKVGQHNQLTSSTKSSIPDMLPQNASFTCSSGLCNSCRFTLNMLNSCNVFIVFAFPRAI